MRFGSTSATRPIPVDRSNVVNQTKQYQATLAPHGQTQRWTYTVPAGKKAVIQLMLLLVQRVTAAAPVGVAFPVIGYTPNGGSFTPILEAALATNGLNDTIQPTPIPAGDMTAGDAVAGYTQDSSTGGTVTFHVIGKVFEYDA